MIARSNVFALALIAVVVTVASGCGGSSEGSGTTATTVTKAGWSQRANAACRRARKGLDERVSDFLAQRRGERPHEVLYADLAHKVLLPTVESEMEGVRALRPPPGERGRISRLLYLEESALTRIVFMQRVPSIAAVKEEFAESAKLLRDYGLPACANGPSTIADAT